MSWNCEPEKQRSHMFYLTTCIKNSTLNTLKYAILKYRYKYLLHTINNLLYQ